MRMQVYKIETATDINSYGNHFPVVRVSGWPLGIDGKPLLTAGVLVITPDQAQHIHVGQVLDVLITAVE